MKTENATDGSLLTQIAYAQELIQFNERAWFEQARKFAHTLTEFERKSLQLTHLKEDSDSEMDFIGHAVIATDADGRIIQMNSAAGILTGCDPAEVNKKLLCEIFFIIDTNTREILADPVKKTLETDEPVRIDNGISIISKNGIERCISLRVIPVKNFQGLTGGAILVFHDISHVDKIRQSFIEREERLHIILNASKIGIVIVDAENQTIFQVNQIASNMIGLPKGEIEGKVCHNFICPAEKGNCPIKNAGKKLDHSSRVLLTANGSPKAILKSVATTSMNGKPFFLETFIDISSQIESKERLEDALVYAKEMALKADSANIVKGEFLSNMSHELRTPMNHIIGMVGILLDTALTSEQREYAEIAQNSAENLLLLINDIFDFSNVQARMLDLETLDFDLRGIFSDIIDMYSVKAREKCLELICIVDPNIPRLLSGDQGRLMQVISNLVGNAIKFTHHGEVILRALLEEESENQVVLRITVHDTGIGIPQKHQESIFLPFTQVDGSNTRKYGGTGLGLAICKQITELMGGKIGVKSEENSGSEFWFTMALKKQIGSEASIIDDFSAVNNIRILVVDSSSTNLLLLKTHKCRVDEAADGFVAIEKLLLAVNSGDPYEFVLIDMQIPETDGFALCEKIKSDNRISQTILIAVTSIPKVKPADVKRFEEAGFAAYLLKPVRHAQLFDCLNMVLERVNKSDFLQESEIIKKHVIAKPVKKRIRILIAEDNIVNQQVLTIQLKKLGYNSNAVANGKEAMQMLRSIPYDIVFMDCTMPELDGYEATRKIRSGDCSELKSDILIIGMGNENSHETKEKCVRYTMNDFISKPIKLPELSEILEKWVVQVKKYSLEIAQTQDNPQLLVFNRNVCLDRIMGDEALMMEIISDFVESFPKQRDVIAQHIKTGDCGSIERLAHSLKGSTACVGAEMLQAVIFGIEQLAAFEKIDEIPHSLDVMSRQFENFKKAIESSQNVKYSEEDMNKEFDNA
ncbi:MAG: response regulator [Candidatus Riflebacteria bacterium]|nr:response regulator [Candidatus Riflebacteria bacterium]